MARRPGGDPIREIKTDSKYEKLTFNIRIDNLTVNRIDNLTSNRDQSERTLGTHHVVRGTVADVW